MAPLLCLPLVSALAFHAGSFRSVHSVVSDASARFDGQWLLRVRMHRNTVGAFVKNLTFLEPSEVLCRTALYPHDGFSSVTMQVDDSVLVACSTEEMQAFLAAAVHVDVLAKDLGAFLRRRSTMSNVTHADGSVQSLFSVRSEAV